jgi:peptidoglycan/xylan/chitin deacetylase (PgdA/CDA1 family)
MSFYWIKTNSFIKKIFSNYVWDIPNSENKIYLTFDDGPTPDITEWVLEELRTQNLKATFFCIGKNIETYPELFTKTINEGHSIGNHTFNHLNGWQTTNEDYLENTKQCEETIQKLQISIPIAIGTKLFRPPYGKLNRSQSKLLQQLGYKIIMWDILSADFDQKISPEKCLENATKKVTSGSVIIFHDSKKASANLKYALPKAIKILKERGFVFDILT